MDVEIDGVDVKGALQVRKVDVMKNLVEGMLRRTSGARTAEVRAGEKCGKRGDFTAKRAAPKARPRSFINGTGAIVEHQKHRAFSISKRPTRNASIVLAAEKTEKEQGKVGATLGKDSKKKEDNENIRKADTVFERLNSKYFQAPLHTAIPEAELLDMGRRTEEIPGVQTPFRSPPCGEENGGQR